MKVTIIFIIISTIIAFIIGGFFLGNSEKKKEEQVFCTQEAKQCPDGSWVGRQGPKCEFFPCPSTKSNNIVGKVYWDIPPGSVSSSLENGIKNAFSTYKPNKQWTFNNSTLAVAGITTSSVSANFVFTSMQRRNDKNETIPSGGFEFIVHKSDGVWKVVAGGDSDFCDVLKSGPSDLIDESRKSYYLGCFPERQI